MRSKKDLSTFTFDELEVVSTIAASALTTTLSVIWPTSILNSRRLARPSSTETAVFF